MSRKTKEKKKSNLLVIIIIIFIIIGLCGAFFLTSDFGKNMIANSKKSSDTILEKGNKDSIEEKNKVNYEIKITGEDSFTIKATKDEETVSRDFVANALIDRVDTKNILNVGNVALVSESGGEYCNINVYQLVGKDIVLIGSIDCGAGMVENVKYEVDQKDEKNLSIKAIYTEDEIEEEVELDGKFIKANIVDFFDYGKLVLVTEDLGENYETQVFRLNQDYINEEKIEIITAGTISTIFKSKVIYEKDTFKSKETNKIKNSVNKEENIINKSNSVKKEEVNETDNKVNSKKDNIEEITSELSGIDLLYATNMKDNSDGTYTISGVIYTEYTMTDEEFTKMNELGYYKINEEEFTVKTQTNDSNEEETILVDKELDYDMYLVTKDSNGKYKLKSRAQIEDVWKKTDIEKYITVSKDVLIEGSLEEDEKETVEEYFEKFEETKATDTTNPSYGNSLKFEFKNGECVKIEKVVSSI